MIKLSRITDYGIVLLAHLAGSADDSSQSAREIARETRLPAPVVSKILKSLARQGLLISHRGAKGGYSLARIPEEISVPEMIGALEGPIGAHPMHGSPRCLRPGVDLPRARALAANQPGSARRPGRDHPRRSRNAAGARLDRSPEKPRGRHRESDGGLARACRNPAPPLSRI